MHSRPVTFWTGQLEHLLALAFLIANTWFLLSAVGHPQPAWFWASILWPVAHQAYVWVHHLCTERPDMRDLYGATD